MAIAESEVVKENQSLVCSYNEWDPLEEVIVGRVSGGSVPPWHVSLQSATPKDSWELLKLLSAKPAPDAMAAASAIGSYRWKLTGSM